MVRVFLDTKIPLKDLCWLHVYYIKIIVESSYRLKNIPNTHLRDLELSTIFRTISKSFWKVGHHLKRDVVCLDELVKVNSLEKGTLRQMIRKPTKTYNFSRKVIFFWTKGLLRKMTWYNPRHLVEIYSD